MSNDYLLVGHFTKDLKEKGFALGGSVYYSGIIAKKLGEKVKIITSFGPDISPEKVLEGFKIVNIPSSQTTTFLNVYKKGKRTQFLFKKAKKISPFCLTNDWQGSKVIHLAPVAQEINEKLFFLFKDSFLGASLQGLLRKKGKRGEVKFNLWKNYKKCLPLVQAAILSEEDIKRNFALAKEMSKFSKILVLTLGEKGCQVFSKGKTKCFGTKKLKIVDTTGAGDTFAAAFLINFQKTKNPCKSAAFANSIAYSFLKNKLTDIS